ncbi:protein-tyrosine phosphatase domain-containing protein [Ditylenchus destructor]|nr:protein-tyrosine phosphatase domain-containing protein [Ditylenchus destructor]
MTEVSEDVKFVMNAFVSSALSKGIETFKQEFAQLAKVAPKPPVEQCRIFNINKEDKARYDNVPCLDATAVKLRIHAQDHFIHANYVADVGLMPQRVATQCPLPGLERDFWIMVIQQKSEGIVNLCSNSDVEQEKAIVYWPQNEGAQMNFGGITVTNTGKEQIKPDLMKYQLMVKVFGLRFTESMQRNSAWSPQSNTNSSHG